MVKGKVEEAKKILINAAKLNNKNITEEELTLLGPEEGENGKQNFGDVRSLFASRGLAHRTLVSWYCW